MSTIICMNDSPMSGAFAGLRRAMNGHAKLAYLVVVGLAVLASAGFLLKLGLADVFNRVTHAAAVVPQHEIWIAEHEVWSQQRNAFFTEGLSCVALDTAVLKAQVQDNKELSINGFEQVIGLLTNLERRMSTIDDRLFQIQGQLRTQAEQPTGRLGR